jgi:nucleotidyltransferase/DNA polymerase involved in DNA repair
MPQTEGAGAGVGHGKMERSENLLDVPGVGPQVAKLLNSVGIHSVSDLSNRSPERLYSTLEKIKGKRIDRCVLYTFRCAVYYASNSRHDPSKLKWWTWKDRQ